jgi:hypothetical protein
MGVQNLITQCRTVLVLVHELHLCGYQRLRAVPEMEHSGKYWRCAIAPASLVSADHGARLAGRHDTRRVATYTSRDQNHYFAWDDIYPYATPKELALYFLERFPDVAEEGAGPDWPYAGWYMEMLRLTQPDHFPYAAARGRVPETYVPTASPASERRPVQIPLPPPGEALLPRPRELRPNRRELSALSARRIPRSPTRRRLAV